MFDKWKNLKIAGTIVILVVVAIFLFINVRIKSKADYQWEKSTGIFAENISEDTSENSTESKAGIVAEDGQTGVAEDGQISIKEDEQTGVAESEQAGIADGEKNNKDNSKQNQPETSNKFDTEAKKTIQVSIEIRCDSAVKIKGSIGNPGIKEKIPDSGEILKETVYSVPEGTNVYDLLSDAAVKNGIAISANQDKTYVMGINYLEQMMLSQQSGWKYSVNGKAPGMPAIKYTLKEGDRVKWFYVLSASEE